MSQARIGRTFLAPLAGESARPAVSPSAERLPPPAGDENVLLVEDEGGVRALARHVLAGCG